MNKTLLNKYLSLTETPLPKEYNPDALDPQHIGSYELSVDELKKKLKDMGYYIASGSSRMAVKVMVDVSQFKPEILQKYDLEYNAERDKVTTVIKLALNGEGIAQNKAELNFWRKFGDSEFFLPIIDDSENNKGLTWGDNNLSNWIQMPFAPEPSGGEFDRKLIDMFGTCNLLYDNLKQTYGNQRIYIQNNKQEVTEKFLQVHDNIGKFIDLMDRTGIRGRDIGRESQWGIWNNKMYIVDYGYDDSTSGYYKSDDIALTFVNKKHQITMDVNLIKIRKETVENPKFKKLLHWLKKEYEKLKEKYPYIDFYTVVKHVDDNLSRTRLDIVKSDDDDDDVIYEDKRNTDKCLKDLNCKTLNDLYTKTFYTDDGDYEELWWVSRSDMIKVVTKQEAKDCMKQLKDRL